ncbi:MAG TPA: T9SS type A sorting domain-containing protein [Saprospiraceae bacterium]|nr:T9SS type A sorting domain-containing protein [Saprospiraceae bacterium]
MTSEGDFDSTFGIDGIVKHTIIGSEVNIVQALSNQSDGKIVMAGINSHDGNYHTSLVRINVDGSIDTTFGEAGMALHDIADSTNFWTSMIVLPDDRLLVAGVANNDGLVHHALAVILSDAAVSMSQPFAPVGASWVHCLQPDIEPGQYHVRVVSTDTTSFQGIACSILRSTDFWKLGAATVDSMLVCSDADKVYYAEGDSLYLLYDFSLKAGELLTIRFPIELDANYQEWFPGESLYWSFLVEAVDTVILDGVSLRRQHLSPLKLEPDFFVYPGDWAIERIGYEQWVFPFLSAGESNAYCYLVEYQDAQIYQIDTSSQCMAVGTNHLTDSIIDADVWPNPCTDQLFVEAEDEILDIRLISLDGTVLASYLRPQLNVAGIPSGIYVLEIVFAEEIVVKKIVKE